MSENESDDYRNIKVEEEMYKFKANKLPTSRNVFYQLCDIDDQEVQEIINDKSNRVSYSIQQFSPVGILS